MIWYQKKELTLGNNSEELFTEGSGTLPFMCYYNEGKLFPGHQIPWHWHDRVEINYIAAGSFRIRTTDLELEGEQGDIIFINKNVLHSYALSESVIYYSITIDAPFLAGGYGSYLDQKYFSPILSSRNLSLLRLRPDTPRRIRLVESLLQSIDLLREEPFGYEILVREAVSRFFLLLLEETKDVLAGETNSDRRDQDRMKLMLQFIYDHYREPITLDEIAQTAGISARECTRCFRRAINRPPVRFLIEYRAQMAALMLVRTDCSISSIAELCGFVSDSYFGKIFREVYGCTPREYRKKQS